MRVLRILALVGALALAAPAAEAAPPNDDFERATVLTPPTLRQDSHVAMDFTGATRQPNEPDHGGVGAPGTVWYVFTAPRDQRVQVVPSGGQVVAVYTGDRLDALKPVAQTTDAKRLAEVAPPPVAWRAVMGTTYRIAIGGSPGLEYSGGISLVDATLPGNDDFADAQPVRVTRRPHNYGGNLGDATSEPGEPPIGASAGRRAERSVWFRFRVRRALGITISASSSHREDTEGCEDPVTSVYVGARLRSLRRIARGLEARVLARPGVPYRIALTCWAPTINYGMTISGRPIRGAGLVATPLWSIGDLEDWGVYVGVTAWRPVRVAVELRVRPATARRLGLPGVRITKRRIGRVDANRRLSSLLRLKPEALAAVRRLRRLRVVLHAETLGGQPERTDVAYTLRRR